jgi:hypothetical protein
VPNITPPGEEEDLLKFSPVREVVPREPRGGEEDLLRFSPLRRKTQSKSMLNEEMEDLDAFLNPSRSLTLIDSDNINLSGAGYQVLPLTTTSKASTNGTNPSAATFQPGIRGFSEIDTRKYYNTMKQKAPSKGKGKALLPQKSPERPKRPSIPPKTLHVDPTEDFRTEIRARMAAILTRLRVYQGEIKLAAQFGRLLIRKLPLNMIQSGDSPLMYDPIAINDMLAPQTRTVGFTRLLTTLPGDARFLVDMKDSDNYLSDDTYHPRISPEALWGQILRRDVTYEYECFDQRAGVPFIVEIDAETFHTKVKSVNSESELGTIYVHCPLRNWDYQIKASGTQNLDSEYGNIAQEIVNSMYIG